MNDSLVATIRQSWRLLVPSLLEQAKSFVNGEPSYICPFCSHGTHGDGLTFDPTNPGRLHCFGPCGWSGDVIDLYREITHCTFQEALVDLSSMLGTSDRIEKKDQQEKGDENKKFIQACQDKFPNSPAEKYLQSRGISIRTARDGGAGYCKAWRHPSVSKSIPVSPRLIIPTSATSYMARDIRPAETLSDTEKKYSKQKVGSVHLYRSKRVSAVADRPIFVVEGEIDALSLMEIGCSVVALGSVSCINMFLRDVAKGPKPNYPFIVALDNDKAGASATERLLDALRGQGLVAVDGHEVAGQYKDVNEAIVADRASFGKRVQEVERIAEEEFQRKETEINSGLSPSIIMISTREYMKEEYDEDIAQFAKFKQRRTGFDNLDEITTFYPGLYAIGGITSLGKTTFVHQLADQVAANGEHVLYFPIEQSPMELISKGISRTMYHNNTDTAIPSIRIRSGYIDDAVMDARRQYSEENQSLLIAKCNFNTTVMDVREIIWRYAEKSGVAPVVVVDYLQALRSPDNHLTQRDAIDLALRTLKDIQTELSATIVIVSSLNRVNYMVPIGFESFKESGGIEYTCDVIWGIDLLCMDDPLFDTQGHIKKKREIINAAKVSTPREVRLTCLKNRYGIGNYSIVFDYIPAYDVFIPKSLGSNNGTVVGKEGCNRRFLGSQDERQVSEEERNEIFDVFGRFEI